MAEWNDNGYKSFICGEAIGQHLRVKLNGTTGKLETAGLADNDLGTVTREAFADGDVRTVAMRTKPGTIKMVAAGAIDCGAKVYTAAGGKISATGASTSYERGIALQAASGDNSVVEVMPVFAQVAES